MSTQAQQLLDFMRRHGAVTVKGARDALGISNVVGRIWDIERGRGCSMQIVQRDQVETVNRHGEVCRVNRYWLAGTPTPPPGVPVVGRRRQRMDEATRLRRVLERRRERIRDLEDELAGTKALAGQLNAELDQITEDRRRTKGAAIARGLAASRLRGRTSSGPAVVQAKLFGGA